MPNHCSISQKPTVAIIGAGASGLMVADYLSAFDGVHIEIYDKLPNSARKILWAGKTGLNISHSEPMSDFVARYDSDWLTPYLYEFDNRWLVEWFGGLGVETYVGSSGRIFPVQMKASTFVRAWLVRLQNRGVKFFYHHTCQDIDKNTILFHHKHKDGVTDEFYKTFDAIVLCCGGGSYPRLGTDGYWQKWFDKEELTPLYASNVGVIRQWSSYMTEYFGEPLKRVAIWLDGHDKSQGDIIITHYGMESGLIYKYNRAMRDLSNDKKQMGIYVDLLPHKRAEDIYKILCNHKKQSLNNVLRKLGLDNVKIALLRECTNKTDWSDYQKMAGFIKCLPVIFEGFRPMAEAISTGGGVKRSALSEDLQLKSNPVIFCGGEMLDFDAPTGGYLLTACFATGQVVGRGVAKVLNLSRAC